MNRQLEEILAYLRANMFWTELGICVFVAMGSAYWVGHDAYKQAGALKDQGTQMEQMRVSADRWLGGFQPATNAETQQWSSVSAALQELGIARDERLLLVELIARRAENYGLSLVRVNIVTSDSIPSFSRTSATPFTFNVAPYGIVVDFRGGLASTRAFIANLPPAVSVQSISIRRGGGILRTRVVLVVYEAVANAPS